MNKKFVVLLALFMMTIGSLSVEAQENDPGWLRLVQFVEDAPTLEVLLDGETAWSDVGWGWVSDFMQVEAGTHQVSIAASEEGAALAPITPVDVSIEVGHHVSIVIVGQPEEALSLQVIDDTASCPQERLTEGACLILVHNIAGAPAMTLIENGEVLVDNVAYGEPTIAFAPARNWDTSMMVAADDPDIHLFDVNTEEDGLGGFWEPNVVYLFGFMGSYPGQPFETYGVHEAHYSPANAVDMMAGFSGLGLQLEPGRAISFDTLLAALEAVGLTDMLSDRGPFTLFAPTDAAFANLPDDVLEEVMADPEALRDILLNHIVEGDLSIDELLEQGAVTTVGGGELTISDASQDDFVFNLNGSAEVEFLDYPVANGRIYMVWNTVLATESD
jgi:uncharacterized surface protein with fasciclin (FAS1) repeats